MPLVLAQSLAAPKLPVSLPALSFPSSVPCTSSLKHKHVSMKNKNTTYIYSVALVYLPNSTQNNPCPEYPHTCCIFLSSHQVLLPLVCWSVACLPDHLERRIDPRSERWYWGRWLLPPNCSRPDWETSALAMHQQLQRENVRLTVNTLNGFFPDDNTWSVIFFLTSNRPVILIKVYPNTTTFPPAHPTAPAAAQRDRHNTIHIRQHDGDTNACREET